MRGLPVELGLVVSLFLLSAARAYPQLARDLTTPCTGPYTALNVNGVSPGSLYELLQGPCASGTNLAPMACRCNLVAYNLRMADGVCQAENPETWLTWAQSNQCNTSSAPSALLPYDTSTIAIPKWASGALNDDGSFDLDAALRTSHGWTTIQIITPILSAVAVAAIAAALFFLYRRVKRHGSLLARRHKPWQSANLHGPRRFFGLIPDRSQVQHKQRKETAWEIDGNEPAQHELFPEDTEGRASAMSFHTAQERLMVEAQHTGHSRTGSTTSLITTESRHSSKSSKSSFLGALATKFSALSMHKAYQQGTAKGPDYRRVHVVQGNADQRFKIDGTETPARNSHFTFPPAPDREESLPSVLDIRRPSTSHVHPHLREDSFPPPTRFTGDDDVPVSDFSLAVSDLVTPISPDSAHNDIVGPRHPSGVNPASPFLPQSRYINMSPRDEHPSALLHRNASTDTLAYQLYPRDPPLF